MPVLPFNPRRQSESTAVVGTFESATAEVIAREEPFTKRWVLYTLVLMIILIIVYISSAKLDRIVVTTGRIVPSAGAVTVQPLQKGILKKILVSVGDKVKKGQVLATLDSTFTQADLEQSQQKIASLGPQRLRMEAEEAGQPYHGDPTKPYDTIQESIWKQRDTEFHAAVSDFDQRINSNEALVAGYKQSISEYEAHLKIAAETEHMYSQLADEKVASRLQLLTAQDQRVEMERKLADAQNNLASTEHLLESLREQRKVYIDKWHDDNLNNLVLVKNELDQAKDDITKAAKMSELNDLVAPVDAVVLQVPALSAGGVAQDAELLFSLMPLGAPLEVDVQVDSRDSGFVKVGDRARIKLDTYRFLEHGYVEGVVRNISQDAFTEVHTQDVVTHSTTSQTRSPYFDARITITGVKLRDVPPETHLVPGMTLQADIVVGRRTILWYLLGGAMRSGSEAMREP